MSKYGNYQIAVNSLSNLLHWKDRIKNEKNLFRKLKLKRLLSKAIKLNRL